MTLTITRKGFLKRAGGGAAAAAVTSGALSATARATKPLDASFTAPYEPNPVIAYPSSWLVYTALLPHVVIPYDVIVCNQQLGPLPDLQGFPDLRAVPADATMLLLFIQEPIPVATASASFPDLSDAINLNGTTMHFSDLGGGAITYAGFRNFMGWYIATSGGSLYSIGVNVYVGPSAGAEWAEVQPIVDSINVPA
jgi:hypothetical protein